MPYDDAFWLPRRRSSMFGSQRPAYNELHDYDFEMRGPYRPGKLLDAYMEWREFQREEGLDSPGRPPEDELALLRRWEAWRRERRGGRARRGIRARRRGPARGPRWPRADL